jgi:methyl-accepting chemotaxis protein
MAHPPYKRKIYLIKKRLQYRFIAWVVGTVMIAVLVVLLDVFISLHRHAQDTGLTIQVSDLYDPTDPFTILKFIIYVAGVFYASLLLSHRVAGPIYRFEKAAEEVAGGNLTHKVFLRREDEMEEMRDSFNAMVDALRGKVAGDVACAFRARRQLEELLDNSPMSPQDGDKIRKVIAEMNRVGKGFQV